MLETRTFLEMVRSSLEISHSYIADAIDGLPDARLAEQPPGVMNHAAWTIGHLATSLQLLGQEVGLRPWLLGAWPAMFGTGSVPLASRNAYPSGDALLAAMHNARERLMTRLSEGGEALLSTDLPSEQLRPYLPTVGHAVVQIAVAHTAYHTGQLVVWRRAMGFGAMPYPYL